MNHIIQKKLFSQDECDYFKSLSNDKTFERSKITEHINSNIISECRTSLEVDIKLDSNLSKIILEKVKEFGIRTLPNYFIILKYDKNQEFKKHTDSGPEYPNRYKTMIVQLSNESEYKGGELCIFEKNEEIITSKDVGTVIIFDSSMEHCANKIIEGVRYSMVLWLSIDDFGLTKSLI